MTVASTVNKHRYSCDGSQKTFAYNFKVFAASHLKVYRWDEVAQSLGLLVKDVDYTIYGVGVEAGGYITTLSAYPAGDLLVLVRDLESLQDILYSEGYAFPALGTMSVLDKFAMILQRFQEKISRAPLMRQHTALSNITLPEPSGESRVLRWNEDATDLEAVGLADLAAAVLPITGLGTAGFMRNTAGGTISGGNKIDGADLPLKEICVGDAGYGPTLRDAVTAIGASNVTLRFPPGDYEVSGTDLEIPTNVFVQVNHGVHINPVDVTVTIHNLSAGLDQVFQPSGTGKIVGLREARPEWFGNNGLRLASQALADGGTLRLAQNLALTVAADILLPGHQRWVVEGGSTAVTYSGAETDFVCQIEVNGKNLEICGGLTFDGNTVARCPLKVYNSVVGMSAPPTLLLDRVRGLNAYSTDTVTHKGTAGIYIAGAFRRVLLNAPTVKNISRATGVGTPGVTGSQGIVVSFLSGHEADAYPQRVVIIDPDIDSVISEEPDGGPNNVDCDGLVVFQPQADVNGGVKMETSLLILGGRYRNCRGRSMKLRSEMPLILAPSFVRGAGCLRSIVSGTEVDFQGGTGTVVGARCYYSNLTDNTTPFGASFAIFSGTVYGLSTYEGFVTINDTLVINNVPTATGWLPYFFVPAASGTGVWNKIAVDDYKQLGAGGISVILYGDLSKVIKAAITNGFMNYNTYLVGTWGDAPYCHLRAAFNYCVHGATLWYLSGSATVPPVFTAPEHNYYYGGVTTTAQGETKSVADDGTYAFAKQGGTGYRVYAISTNDSRLTCGLFAHDGTCMDLTNGLSTNIAYGNGTNPDTDGKLNVWRDAAGRINIKNRIGATLNVTLRSL